MRTLRKILDALFPTNNHINTYFNQFGYGPRFEPWVAAENAEDWGK